MRKIVSILSLLLIAGLISVSAQCCSTSAADNSADSNVSTAESKKVNEVKVYYFHSTRRCATCQAVEDVSKEAINEYYGDKVSFTSVNRDNKEVQSLLKKYNVSGQTLLIVNGNKKVNLTNDAFLNARTNPDKLKSKIKTTIDSML